MSLKTFFLVLGLVLFGLLAALYQQTQPIQRGYRGTGMVLMYKPDAIARQDALNQFPKPLKAAKTDGPLAKDAYQNVQVLGDLTQAQLVRLMLSIKGWVAPQVGCNYCHNAPDYASDVKYPKRVARQMLRMVRHINADWSKHVQANGATGVTCYTCHRGQPVPAREWYAAPTKTALTVGFSNLKSPVRPATLAAANTVLAPDALSEFLLGSNPIRVVGLTPLTGKDRHIIQNTRDTYSLMMQMSESLGVNCNFCHNSRAFYSWPSSSPQRVTAWYGIRMVRDINNNFVAPLNAILPPERLGPTGDSPKVYCATCHQGSNRPLGGAPMLPSYPELIGTPQPTAETTEAPPGAPTPAPAPVSAPAPNATPTAAAMPATALKVVAAR